MKPAWKKWRWHLLCIVVCLAIATLAMVRSTTNGLRAMVWGVSIPSWNLFDRKVPIHGIKLGIYDSDGTFSASGDFGIEQFFLDWTSYDSEDLKTRMMAAVSRGRWLMLTVEPWPYERSAGKTSTLFADILAGGFDDAITRLCRDINAVGSPVFIRWGHEMENVNDRYAWAQNDTVGYVKSYRYFVDTCRRLLTPEAFFVWSPVGRVELFRYWPGPDYVDQIGVSIYGFPEYDLKNYGWPRSFEEVFSETYQRVALFDKPIIIAELGVAGDEHYQRDWMHSAFRKFGDYPKLQAAVYFSAQDSPLAWGSDYSVPDWRISPSVFEKGP